MAILLTGAENAIGKTVATALRQGYRIGHITPADLGSRPLAAAALTRVATETEERITAVVHTHVSRESLHIGPMATMTDAEWDAAGEAPIRNAIHLLQASYEHLRHDGGTIIFVLPTFGLAGQTHCAAYAAACEAQRNLVKASARAWGRKGIRVHAITVGAEAYADELQPFPHNHALPAPSLPGQNPTQWLQHVAATVTFLLSEGAAGLTGTTTAVDGGRWMPL